MPHAPYFVPQSVHSTVPPAATPTGADFPYTHHHNQAQIQRSPNQAYAQPQSQAQSQSHGQATHSTSSTQGTPPSTQGLPPTRRNSSVSSLSSAESLSSIWRAPSGSQLASSVSPTFVPCWNIWAPLSQAAHSSLPSPSSGHSASQQAIQSVPSVPSVPSVQSVATSHTSNSSPTSHASHSSSQHPHSPHPLQQHQQSHQHPYQYQPQLAPSSPPPHHPTIIDPNQQPEKWGSPLWFDVSRFSPSSTLSNSVGSVVGSPTQASSPPASTNSHGNASTAGAAASAFVRKPSQQSVTISSPPYSPENALSPIEKPQRSRSAEKTSILLDTPESSSDEEAVAAAAAAAAAAVAGPGTGSDSGSKVSHRSDSFSHIHAQQLRTATDIAVESEADADPSLIAETSGPLYLIQFKGNRLDVYTAPSSGEYHNGQLVIVDADRGKDLGKVIASNISRQRAAALKLKQHVERQNLLASCANSPSSKETSAPLGLCAPKQILRAAQQSEVTQISSKRHDEAAAVTFCNNKAKDRGLDMTIVDAEYQWDRRKLTFFYQAGHRVDFRELVRELFRTYKTRIWMCAVPVPDSE